MKVNHRLEITHDHIIRGVPGEEMACPIALAGIESMDVGVEVYDEHIYVNNVGYLNSWPVRHWIKSFDVDREGAEPIVVLLVEDTNGDKLAFIEGEES